MMNAWGEAPWRIDVDLPQAALPAHCDIAVVGAGFTGLAAAYTLARAGRRVAVFEAEQVGAGASGRTGGIVLEGTASGALPEVDDCIGMLQRVVQDAGIDCDLRLDGCWELWHRPESADALWHDGESALSVAGTVDGGSVDPGALVSGLGRAAARAGAVIYEHAAVTRLDLYEPPRLRVRDRDITADCIVLALNAYTPTLIPLPSVRAPLTLAVCTDPLDATMLDAIGLQRRLPFYTVDLPYIWGRALGDGRIIFGSGLVFDPDDDVRRIRFDDEGVQSGLVRLEQRIRGFHPMLARVRIASRWGGPIAFRRNAPLLGRHPQRGNILVTGAYAGHGVALSVRIGVLVAEAIANGLALPQWGAF